MSEYIRDYGKGKIYKIVADTEEEYKPYVGSTIQGLAERMAGHRASYSSWKKGKLCKCLSYDLFDKFGIENCKIILLEEYPCDSKMKLLMKEREWFDKIENCNKLKPFVSKEERNKYIKNYTETHKNEINEYHNQYREINKDILNKKQKSYADKNRNVIREKNKETFMCICGEISTICNKSRHKRSLKHQNYLSISKSQNVILS